MTGIPNQFLDIYWLSSSGPPVDETSSFARVDWKETHEDHVYIADLPGIKKQNVKVEIEEGRALVLKGQSAPEMEDLNDIWHRVERSHGKFHRTFLLLENANVDGVKASMENGVLTVTVPKQEIKKPEVKTIEISG